MVSGAVVSHDVAYGNDGILARIRDRGRNRSRRGAGSGGGRGRGRSIFGDAGEEEGLREVDNADEEFRIALAELSPARGGGGMGGGSNMKLQSRGRGGSSHSALQPALRADGRGTVVEGVEDGVEGSDGSSGIEAVLLSRLDRLGRRGRSSALGALRGGGDRGGMLAGGAPPRNPDSEACDLLCVLLLLCLCAVLADLAA